MLPWWTPSSCGWSHSHLTLTKKQGQQNTDFRLEVLRSLCLGNLSILRHTAPMHVSQENALKGTRQPVLSVWQGKGIHQQGILLELCLAAWRATYVFARACALFSSTQSLLTAWNNEGYCWTEKNFSSSASTVQLSIDSVIFKFLLLPFFNVYLWTKHLRKNDLMTHIFVRTSSIPALNKSQSHLNSFASNPSFWLMMEDFMSWCLKYRTSHRRLPSSCHFCAARPSF